MKLAHVIRAIGDVFRSRGRENIESRRRCNRHYPNMRYRDMPARSKKQQMAAGAALAAKRGEQKKSSLKGASKQMADSMSEKQLKDFAKTSRKKLPTKKK